MVCAQNGYTEDGAVIQRAVAVTYDKAAGTEPAC